MLYKEMESWKFYQRYFPEEFHISEEIDLVEDWFSWGKSRIHLDHYKQKKPLGRVFLLHGGGGFGRMLSPYAVFLWKAGYEVIAPDMPGYGLSETPDEQIDYRSWVDCLRDLVVFFHEKEPSVDCYLMGASMGGYLAYMTSCYLPFLKGLIVTTLADPREPLVRKQFAKYSFLSSWGIKLASYLPRWIKKLRVPIRWFCKMDKIANDKELSSYISKDTLGGGRWVPIAFLLSIFGVKPMIEPEGFDVCPLALLHPAQDEWTTVEASRLFFDRIKGKKKLFLLEGCGHFPYELIGFETLKAKTMDLLQSR